MNRRDFIIGSASAAALAPALSRAHIGARGSVSPASGETFDYYISPSATPSNDGGTNTGALSHPWSLNALNTQGSTYAGKSVGIIGDQGSYDCLSIYIAYNGGSTLGNPNQNAQHPPAFNIAAGTSGSPTYVGSCNSSGTYVPRLAVLDGGSTSLSQSATVNPGANGLIGALGSAAAYITIDGLVFQNNYYSYVYFGYETDVTPSGRSPGITVQNCHFGGSGTLYNSIAEENPTFLTLYACEGALIQNNLMDGATDDSTDRFCAFETWATTGTVFQYNTVQLTQSSATCWFIKNINNTTATIRYNYFYAVMPGGADGWDLSGDSSDTSYFYNNVVVVGDQALNTPGEAMTDADSTEIKYIYNNTFVALGGAWANGGIYQQSAAGTVTFYNNIVNRTGTPAWEGDVSYNYNSLALSDYNLYPSTPYLGLMTNGEDSQVPTIYTSISTFAAQLPSGCVGKDAHSVLGAPMFVGGSPTFPAEAYKLASGSLGVGAGSSNGQTSGSATDMGAWGGTDVNTGNPISQIGCNFT
jgi:hypothetical protein